MELLKVYEKLKAQVIFANSGVLDSKFGGGYYVGSDGSVSVQATAGAVELSKREGS